MAQGPKKETIFNRTNGRCAYCGEELNPFTFHREHVIPTKRGGPHRISNIVASCKNCNCRKRTKTLKEFRAHIRNYPISLLHGVIDHFDKYMNMLSDEEIAAIEDAIWAVVPLIEALRPQFYVDELDVELFMDGHAEAPQE